MVTTRSRSYGSSATESGSNNSSRPSSPPATDPLDLSDLTDYGSLDDSYINDWVLDELIELRQFRHELAQLRRDANWEPSADSEEGENGPANESADSSMSMEVGRRVFSLTLDRLDKMWDVSMAMDATDMLGPDTLLLSDSEDDSKINDDSDFQLAANSNAGSGLRDESEEEMDNHTARRMDMSMTMDFTGTDEDTDDEADLDSNFLIDAIRPRTTLASSTSSDDFDAVAAVAGGARDTHISDVAISATNVPLSSSIATRTPSDHLGGAYDVDSPLAGRGRRYGAGTILDSMLRSRSPGAHAASRRPVLEDITARQSQLGSSDTLGAMARENTQYKDQQESTDSYASRSVSFAEKSIIPRSPARSESTAGEVYSDSTYSAPQSRSANPSAFANAAIRPSSALASCDLNIERLPAAVGTIKCNTSLPITLRRPALAAIKPTIQRPIGKNLTVANSSLAAAGAIKKKKSVAFAPNAHVRMYEQSYEACSSRQQMTISGKDIQAYSKY